MTKGVKVTLVSNFDEPVRGVSPYSDGLYRALELHEKIDISAVDYHAAMPELVTTSDESKNNTNLHYLKPWTWFKLARQSAPILHLQYWTQFQSYYLLFITRKARKLGKRVVITVHNTKPHESIPGFALLEKALFRHADRLIVHTDQGRDDLIKSNHQLKQKITCIAHGIEFQTDEKMLDKTLLPEERYILFAGNIRPYKGVDLLLSAWDKIRAEHNDLNYRLVIAGRIWGGEKVWYKKLIYKLLGTEQFGQKIKTRLSESSDSITTYAEFIPNEQFRALLKHAEIVVLPYRHFNAASGIVSQTIGFGTPIMTSDIQGLKSFTISEQYVFTALDEDVIAKELWRQINRVSTDDRVLQSNLAMRYRWEMLSDDYYTMYCQLL